MKWAAAAAAAGIAVVAYAVYQGGSLAWHLLGFMLAATILIVISQMGPLSAVAVERTFRSGPHQAGDSLQATLTVASKRAWLWPYLVVSDELPQVLQVSAPRFVLRRTASPAVLTYRIPELKRGVYDLDIITLTTGDPFGLIRRTREISAPSRLVVWPNLVPLGNTRLTARLLHGDNRARRPSRQESTHIRGIREYAVGDRLSHVHWKTSAHTGEFKVKQFEPETQPEFTILLDRAATFSRNDWELAISAAASLVRHAQLGRQSIGLAAADDVQMHFPPSVGSLATTNMMNALSALPYQQHSRVLRLDRRFEGRLVVIAAVSQVDSWRGRADLVIGVGPGGVTDLEGLPQFLSQVPSDRGGES